MARTLSRFRVLLDFAILSDAARQAILSGIKETAPSSSVYAGSPSIQTSYAALVTKGATLQASNATVAADKQKLRVDIGAEVGVRSAFDVELRKLASLTEASATSSADLSSMGFQPRTAPTISTTPPAPPASITIEIPKRGRGIARAIAVFSGKGRPNFAAESSPDPVTATSWSTLPGAGKRRTLTGASGTRVWVRFATMRGQAQSDWCTPVLVTIP